MIKLSKKQLQEREGFIQKYMGKGNNATLSEVDPNSNVSSKNVATLSSEINKDINVQVNRYILGKRIEKLFGRSSRKQYEKSLNKHEIYSHDESSVPNLPYCMAIDLHPFLTKGMKPLGGESDAPQHIASFAGSYINLMFAISAQQAGAVADVSFLTYFNYFAVKDYGVDYLETHTKDIENAFQHIIFSINEPAAARGNQSIFYNTSVFDKYYFDALFGKVLMPDGTNPVWAQVKRLQEYFLTWFNKERETAMLTFPVITAAFLTENGRAKDAEFKEFLAKEMSEGNSFFLYSADSVDSLASCCRLRNAIDPNAFNYSLGGTGIAVGSQKVFTLNINRMVQDGRNVKTEIQKLHKYLVAYSDILHDLKEAGLLPVYDAGYIDLSKQYLTIGVNGITEAAEYLGYTISNNPEYLGWVKTLLGSIMEENKLASKYYTYLMQYKVMFNTEIIPAENLGVKNSKWDKKDGYMVNRDCYNSYLYLVEDEALDVFDKFEMHGRDVLQYLDGGSALHLNLKELLSQGTWVKLIDKATEAGCNYFTYNTRSTCCESCGHNDKRDLNTCPKCGSFHITWATRVIGYLKKIPSFSEGRQKEAGIRTYHKNA